MADAQSIQAGGASVKITANTISLQASLDRALNKVGSFAHSVENRVATASGKASLSLGKIGSGAAAGLKGIGGALGSATKGIAGFSKSIASGVFGLLSETTVDLGSAAGTIATVFGKASKIALAGIGAVVAGLAAAVATFLATDKRLLSPEESAAQDAMRESVDALAQSAQSATAAFVTAFHPAISAVIDTVRHGMAAFREWIATQADLIAGITSFLGGIRDALSAGDIAGAAKILWQGVKVAWQTGIVNVMDATLEWKTSLQQTMSEAFLVLVDIATRAWDGIKDAARVAADFIVDVYHRAVDSVARALTSLAEQVGLVDEGASAALGEDQASRQRTRQEERAKRDAAIAKERRAQEEAFGETVAEANRMIAEANRDALKAAQNDLARAKGELDSLIGDAAKKAEEVGRKLPDAVKLGDVKTSVVGTFSGAAAAGLDVSMAPMKKVEENTKKTASATERMADALDDIRDAGGLAYT